MPRDGFIGPRELWRRRKRRLTVAVLVVILLGICFSSSAVMRKIPDGSHQDTVLTAGYIGYLKNVAAQNAYEGERYADKYPQIRSVLMEAARNGK